MRALDMAEDWQERREARERRKLEEKNLKRKSNNSVDESSSRADSAVPRSFKVCPPSTYRNTTGISYEEPPSSPVHMITVEETIHAYINWLVCQKGRSAAPGTRARRQLEEAKIILSEGSFKLETIQKRKNDSI